MLFVFIALWVTEAFAARLESNATCTGEAFSESSLDQIQRSVHRLMPSVRASLLADVEVGSARKEASAVFEISGLIATHATLRAFSSGPDDDDRKVPGWLKKQEFLAMGPCLEDSRMTVDEKELLREIWRFDYTWHVLTDAERDELVTEADMSLRDRVQTYFVRQATAWVDVLKSTKQKKRDAEETAWQQRITHLQESIGRRSVFYEYLERRHACETSEFQKLEMLQEKYSKELTGHCSGKANHVNSQCTVKYEPCPEGTICGVWREHRSKIVVAFMAGVIWASIFLSIAAVAGFAVSAAIPFQMETATAISLFLASHNHQCSCMPTTCIWDKTLGAAGACVPQSAKHPTQSVTEYGGINMQMWPLAGFKCVEDEQSDTAPETCVLQTCEEADYAASGIFDNFTNSSAGELSGLLGIEGKHSYNCWRWHGTKSAELPYGSRITMYQGVLAE